MDSKEEMTLSQKIVTDAVLKMDDYKKMKWLTRRYGKGKELDKAFDKVFSSLEKTNIYGIERRIKLLQDLNASHDRISNEIEDLIENVTQDKIDLWCGKIIDIINTIKDNQLKFELIEFCSSYDKIFNELEKSRYSFDGEKFDRCVIGTLEESNDLKSILSLLSLRATDHEIIEAIGNKLSSIELTPEVIQTIANMPKIEIEEKPLGILHHGLLRDNEMSKATLILFNVIKEEQKMELLNNNLFIIPNIETELEKSNAKEKEALKSLYKTLTPFLLPKNAPEKLAYEYYGDRYRAGTLSFETMVKYKDFLKDVDLRPALFWYKTLDNFKNQDEMFEYFDMLETWSPDSHSYYSGLYFSYSNDFNLKEAISNKCCESIKKYYYTPLMKENCPQSFVEEHKELFLPDDIPSDLKQMIHDGKWFSYIIVDHPEWVKYFKNIDLNLVGKLFDNNNELIDSNSVLPEFNSREDALLCLSYFTEFCSYATKDISQNNIKQRMFDTIYSRIINEFNPIGKDQAGYAFALPEEFKKKYPELFLPENAPDELKNKVYHYKLEPKDIVEHPEWIHYLSKINLNIIIPNYDKTETHTSEVDSFKNQEETIKYIAMLNYIRGNKDRFYNSSSINVKNEFIKSIKNIMTDYEYYPTIFTPNIFFDSSVIDAIKENNLDQSFGYLRFYCQGMSLNPEEVAKYFESREDAIKCCMMYKYIQHSYINFYELNTDNIKESLLNMIRKAIGVGILPYNEDMPEVFKKEFPEMFLNANVPEELKQLIYSRKFRTKNLLDNSEQIDMLIKKNINLNVLFYLESNNKIIDVDALAEQFDSREDAIKTFAMYKVFYNYYNNNRNDIDIANPKESIHQIVHEEILEGSRYFEHMPEDFKKEFPDLFLSTDAPVELKQLMYDRNLEGKNLLDHPEWIDVLTEENINLNVLFNLRNNNNEHIDANTLAEQFDSREDAIKTFAMYKVFYYYHDIDIANPKESIHQIVHEEILEGSRYFEDMPEDFKKEFPDLFLSTDAPVELKQLMYDRNLEGKNLLDHPEWIDVLAEENINLNVLFNLINNNNEHIDANTLAEQFDSREDAIKTFAMYTAVCNNNNGNDIDIENPKESIHQIVHESILTGSRYFEHMPEDFKKEFPDLFLSTDAPEKLKQLMYDRNLRGKDLLDYPEWMDVVTKKNINLNVLFNLINNNNEHIDVEAMSEQFDSKEVAIKTFAMYTAVCNNNNGNDIDIENPKESIYPIIYEEILEGSRYFEDMPEDFKKNYPDLFLSADTPKDIKTKFYAKELTLQEFRNDPNLIESFGKTNCLFGFNKNYLFLNGLFKGDNINLDYLKAIEIFDSSTNSEEAEFIRNSIKKSNMRAISIDKFPDLIELHKNVQYSNSIELSNFKDNYMPEILNSDNLVATFKLLEDIFLKNSLPGYAKLFKCFKTIYPTFEKPGAFNFTPGSRISPELLEAGDAEHRFLIIYNDLLRIAIHSQDSSLVEYLDNIDKGSELYFALCKKEKTIETISNEEVEELTTFASHLESIYEGISFSYQDELKELTPEQNNSVKKFKLLDRMSAKDYFKDRNDLVQIDELEKYKRAMLKTKISILSNKFNASTIESADNLKDKIVSYIGHSAGYDSFNQMVEDINKIRNETDKRNRKRAEEYRNKPFMFEEGDFLRCIGGIKALTGSINKGNVSKEFMCSYAGTSGSDTTPLDVDISYISPKSGITTSIDGTPTGWGFGNVFVVIKKNNPNLNITRDITNNPLETNYVPDKVEMFQTGYELHWGARTGITFTDIDFILYKETKIIERNADGLPQVDENGDIVYVKDSIQRPYDKDEWIPIVHDALAEIQFEIARNGYYIPVFDMLGRLSFTPEQYDELRSKMCGLPHYTSEEYHISNKLDFPGIDELIEIKKADMKKTAAREKLIREKIKEILKTSKLKVDTIAVTDTLSTDLTEGIVQLIGTGSTSRGTNVPDDSDFDYMLKVDKKVVQTGMDELISSLKNIKHDEDNSHDSRVKLVGVTIDGLDIKIDTDISIAQKQNDITYSTEMALEERLETIRKQSQSAYEKVIANIVYAKQFLKEIGAYKHARVDKTSGGLGGVGVENWILQNGGSFRQACETFMDKAIDHETGQIVPFEKFRKTYTIWDFGENHESKGQHPFDEYVSLNMNEAGYNKLVKELPKKLKEINEGLSKNRTIESTTPIIEEEIIEEEPLEASVGFGR